MRALNRDRLPIDILTSTRAVVWNYEPRDGKATKVPYCAHAPGRKADVTDPRTWSTFDTAYDAVMDGKADGVGIVLRDGDLIGGDLDHCVIDGVITAEALVIIRALNSYTELSPSKTGVHVLARGVLPPGGRKKNGYELYGSGRFFTITGDHLDGTPTEICERTAELAAVHAQIFGPADPPRPEARPVQPTSLDDAALLAKAAAASNGATFTALWNGDLSAYANDDSAGDLALCNVLAFWTGCDADRVDRLFRQSALMRSKWDSKRGVSTYGAITIAKAIAGCAESYTDPIVIDLEDEPPAAAAVPSHQWPTLDAAALVGLFGDCVTAIAPHTEADPVGILAHLVIFFGNLLGRQVYVEVGDDRHPVNENVIVAGDTSMGRKGTALNNALAVMAAVDPDWHTTRLQSGLSSGEGLIFGVRDPEVEDGEITDVGVADKRLMIVETEFAKVLRVSRRESNILSTVLRQCWDSGDLRVLTRTNPLKATGAHVSVIGHCTPLELRQEVKTTDMGSGFVNRFLLVCVKRQRILPIHTRLEEQRRAELVQRFRMAVDQARQVHQLTRDADAIAHWIEIYPHLTRARVGLVGSICNRGPAHVIRLAALYALADGSPVIQRAHQAAALAVWEYSEASAALIFGSRVGHRLANFLLELMRSAPTGVTRTKIRDALGRNRKADEVSEALDLLRDLGLATCVSEPSSSAGGRPAERWKAETTTTEHDQTS